MAKRNNIENPFENSNLPTSLCTAEKEFCVRHIYCTILKYENTVLSSFQKSFVRLARRDMYRWAENLTW